MKKYLTIAVIAVVVIFVAALVKDLAIKVSVEKGVELVTGLKLKIGSINVGILKPVVHIKNLKLLNPRNFPDRTMIDMPEIYVRYNLPAIIGGKIHLPEVRIALKEFIVVKNSKGELNLDSLKVVEAEKKGEAPSKEAAGKAPEIQIDSLTLSIGKAVYKDYSKGGEPVVREFNVDLNEKYTNVNDPYALASLIVVKALMNTSISSLANFDLKGLQGTVGDTLGKAEKIASGAVTQVQAVAAAAGVGGATGETAKSAQETVKKTAETLKNVLSNPFGSE